MAPLFVRRWLKRVGLLEPAQALKKRVVGASRWFDFKPADPRTQVSTIKCFHTLQERGLLEGTDYYEFGIFRGFNLWFTQAYARTMGVRNMRFFGFDSFFGLPPGAGVDRSGPFHEGDFSAYRVEVETYFNRFGVDWNQTLLVEGFFDKSLNAQTIEKYGLKACSLCNVDCDLYSSTVEVLAFVEPLLIDQAIIYFDDWGDYGDTDLKGEPKAFAEFQAQTAGRLEFEPFIDLVKLGGKGKAFITHRRSSSGQQG